MSSKKEVSLEVRQLDNFVYDMSRCIKCKGCYWVEHTYMPGIKFSTRCPSNTWNDFDSYGAFGKMRIGIAVAEGKTEVDTETPGNHLCGSPVRRV